MMHDATPPRCVITNEIQSHDSNRDLKALCRKNFSWRQWVVFPGKLLHMWIVASEILNLETCKTSDLQS